MFVIYRGETILQTLQAAPEVARATAEAMQAEWLDVSDAGLSQEEADALDRTHAVRDGALVKREGDHGDA